VSRRPEPLLVALVGLLGSVAVGIADGVTAAAQTAVMLAVVGVATLAAGRALARRRGRIGSLRLLLLLATALAVAQLLVAAAAFAGLMFVSAHDALLLSLVAVYCGVVGAAATRPVAEGVIEDITALRDGLDAVASGRRELDVDPATGGELGELGRAHAGSADSGQIEPGLVAPKTELTQAGNELVLVAPSRVTTDHAEESKGSAPDLTSPSPAIRRVRRRGGPTPPA
jgi:hypothetical protein